MVMMERPRSLKRAGAILKPIKMQIPGVQISIVLDKSGDTPVIRVTDTSTYGGTATGITGIVKVKQPDGITVDGSFDTPDISYVGSALTVATKELRLANDANFQKGIYVITYTARHAGFDDTEITQDFTLIYKRPKGVITPNVDVFTPALKANDTTSYALTNFSLQSVVRSWEANSVPGQILGGDVTQFDLSINGNYYDSKYDITLEAIISYLLDSASNVSIVDKFSVDAEISTVVPLSLNSIFALINTYERSVGKANCSCKEEFCERKDNYIYAYTLFMNFMHRGTCGDKTGLIDLYNKLIAVLKGCAPTTPALTNAIIPTYNFGNFCGIGNVTVPLVITQQPQSRTVTTGASVNFTVAASGLGPLTYQWRKNGVAINGATNNILNIASASAGDQAVYDVIVGDALNNFLTSTTATLTVNTAAPSVTAKWGWFTDNPLPGLLTADNLVYQGSGPHTPGQPLVADFRPAPQLQYLVAVEPDTEPVRTTYGNGPSIFGNIGGQNDDGVWIPPFTARGLRYYVLRNASTFDPNFTTTLS